MKYLTTAPVSYDGFGTTSKPTNLINSQGKPFREVEIRPEHHGWQINRYSSGMHSFIPQNEWEEWKGYLYLKQHKREYPFLFSNHLTPNPTSP